MKDKDDEVKNGGLDQHDDLDLSDDTGHTGDDWDSLLKETGADQLEEQGGNVLEFKRPDPELDQEAAGYRDVLAIAFRTTAGVLGTHLEEFEIQELARAWGRVADHYLPDCPTQSSPLADALFTTGSILAPRVIAHYLQPAGAEPGPEQGPEPGPEPEPKKREKVVPIRPDDPNAWATEKERDW